MATEKGLYWLALGLVAITLVNGTQFCRQCWLGRLEDRSIALAQRLSGRTMFGLSLTEMRLGSQSYRCPRTQAAAARVQAKLACMEGAMARQQAEFARIQAERARLETLRQMRSDVLQPRRDFVIQVPEVKPIPSDGTI